MVVTQLFSALVGLVALSFLAFWRPSAHLFMILAGISIMLGLYWFDIYTDSLGMGCSIGFIGYSFLCLGYAIKVMLWHRDDSTVGE